MIVQILVDNKNSWYVPFAKKLKEKLSETVESVYLIYEHSEVVEGDILCLISCEKIFNKLALNKSNVVVHESDLPRGKGWSPLSWQVLEGKKRIPVTLFEAQKNVDAGVIYLREFITLKGDELLEEIKYEQGILTNKLLENYICNFPNIKGKEQVGESTFYDKRTPKHSELDTNKSIKEQFNLLRIVDNEKYPAFFMMNGIKYTLKINKESE